MCTNGRGTNSVSPTPLLLLLPLLLLPSPPCCCSCRLSARCCSSLSATRCAAQVEGPSSTLPNMRVEVVRRPTRCAADTTWGWGNS